MEYIYSRVPSPTRSKLLILSDFGHTQESKHQLSPRFSDDTDLESPLELSSRTESQTPVRMPRKKRAHSRRSDRDFTDKMPSNPTVTLMDLCCHLVCIPTFFIDIVSDLVVAWYHHQTGNLLAFGLIFGFTIVPSLFLNVLSFIWFYSDYKKRPEDEKSKLELMLKLCACLLQFGTVLWHLDAFRYGWRFRKMKKAPKIHVGAIVEGDQFTCNGFIRNNERDANELYLRMLEADRDATLIRMFEAFAEAAPQTMVQAHLIGYALWQHRNLLTAQSVMLQSASVYFSLCAVSWSLVAQHRCLRFALEDKNNMSWAGSIFQLWWRFFTIGSRVVILTLFALAFKWWLVVFAAAHYAATLLHLTFCQPIDMGIKSAVNEVMVFLAAGFVHLFAPLNLVEGKTRWRYFWCYFLEICEFILMAVLCALDPGFDLPEKISVIIVAACMLIFGLSVMCLYFKCCHPSRSNIKQKRAVVL